MRKLKSKVKEALLFLKKKQQKNFYYTGAGVLARARPDGMVQGSKSFFGSFFSKKELLSFKAVLS
jgi:hypothetical protein